MSASKNGNSSTFGGSPHDQTAQVQGQVDEVVEIMQDNIAKVIKRGDDLEDLQNKSEGLQNSSLQFRRGATKVRKQMWWKDMKLKIILLVLVIVLVALLIVWISHKSISKASSGK